MEHDDIEQHLKALGFFNEDCYAMNEADLYREKIAKEYCCPTMEKGYFNDPRDGNGEVPY